MSETLTQLIARVQALLLDSGTNYTTATCTAALRQALKEWNQAAPIYAGTLIDVIADQYEYELDSSDFTDLLKVQAVNLKDPSGGENDTELDFIDYWMDNRPYIQLNTPQSSGELEVRFTLPNTVSGLDSATESTLPGYFEQGLVMGGAYYAICIRSTGRVETINLNADVPDNLRENAANFYLGFLTARAEAAARKARPARKDPTWKYEPTEY